MSPQGRFKIATVFLAVVLSGLAWRLFRFFLHFDMTGDESNLVNTAMERTYAGLVQPLGLAQASPPGFLWLTKALDGLFANDWAARSVPFLAGLGALAMFWALCRKVLRGAARWVAWAVFGVSYVPVVQGACAKGYTIDLLIAMVLFWLMARWLLEGQRARDLVWLAWCAPWFVWLSYTSIFVIGAIGLLFLACQFTMVRKADWTNLAAGVLFLALAGGSALWLYQANIAPALPVSWSSGLQDFWYKGFAPVHHPWLIPLWLLEVHTGRGFAWPLGENHFLSSATTLLWLTGLVVYWQRGNRWLWALFIIAQLLLLAASFLHKYPYGADPRVCIFLGPGICLFAAAGLEYWFWRAGHRRGRLLYLVVALLLLGVAIGGVTRDLVLRIRETNGPDLRSTLVAAARVVGARGQFLLLPGNRSTILTYYLRRYVTQPVCWSGQIRREGVTPGSNLAVIASAPKADEVDPAVFDDFQKRLGQPLRLIWTRVARVQPVAKEGSVMVRIYRVG